MPAKPRWTLWRIEKAIRREFVGRALPKVCKMTGSSSAGAEWIGKGPIKLPLDPFGGGHLESIIHELTHVVLWKELDPFVEYGRKPAKEGRKVMLEPQELFVGAIEKALTEQIMSNARRREWWRKAIAKKLG